jgi:hypothetical protein
MLLLRINTTSLALGFILTLGCAPKAPKTPCTTQDSFHKSSHYLLEINKPEKAFAIINQDAAKFPHRSLFPWSVFITISPKEMRGLGFPTSAEMQRLDKIEENIVEQLLKNNHLCYVGHIRHPTNFTRCAAAVPWLLACSGLRGKDRGRRAHREVCFRASPRAATTTFFDANRLYKLNK